MAGLYVLRLRYAHPEQLSDVHQLLIAARAWLNGSNPYEAVRTSTQWPFPLLYPFPAVIVIGPLAGLPAWAADALFTAAGTAVLAWALTRERLISPAALALVSAPFLHSVVLSQWSPALTGAALLPWLGFVLVCKPNVGLALFAAYPSVAGAISAAALVALSLVVMPRWPLDWRAAAANAPNSISLLTLPGGPLLLLALLRWRRPEARLLAVLGAVPQTTLAYAALPLFLIPKTWAEAWMVWAGTAVALIGHGLTGPYDSQMAWVRAGGMWLLYCAFLPCVAMVLRRRHTAKGKTADRRS